ncbi:MAG: hypothetical protein L6R37_002056 [Teloschistes peruensis]|nr:MAG: hypothetical protein L6R37_002056 [Teloschistes peruensis]
MDRLDVSTLVRSLTSEEDGVRKMAVFKLQTNISDPSFADMFISQGGLTKLRYLVLNATGNTLAYSLTSFSRLLEVDKGWEYINQDVVERVVNLVVTHPLVNILRGAMAILAAIVSHQRSPTSTSSQSEAFGFRALKPAIAIHPEFLEMLVSRLSSADHALCANALQLINGLMRDAISNEGEAEWPKFVARLQDLGVISNVYTLMQSTAVQDLAHPLLEFQGLTKTLLRKYRDVPIDLHRPEHRRALKGVHLSSNPDRSSDLVEDGKDKKHNPEKWRRLGFETENPGAEFEEAGYLGMMDLVDYVRKQELSYQKTLLEQSILPPRTRCPIARASLAVTVMLYDLFEAERSDLDDSKSYLALESKSSYDRIFKPLILQWSRIHLAGLQAFFRLWKATGAEREEFAKLVDLVRVLLETVVGGAKRETSVEEVETEIREFDHQRLRQVQMELFHMAYEDTWGPHLRQVRDETSHEAVSFMKEQRIRCLLAGAWFPTQSASKSEADRQDSKLSQAPSFRYVKLSHNRRYLHYGDFDIKGDKDPELDSLPEKLDLAIVSSVASNITTKTPTSAHSHSSNATLKNVPQSSTTQITIHGYLPSSVTPPPETSHPAAQQRGRSDSRSTEKSATKPAVSHYKKIEIPLLILHPKTHSLASEWLDGLLMLLAHQPLTSETKRLTSLLAEYGMKIRLMNVNLDQGGPDEDNYPHVPSREGLDEDYYYDMGGT